MQTARRACPPLTPDPSKTKDHLDCLEMALFALPRVSDESVIDQSPSYS
jgi:hypothetical protein